MFSWIVFDFGLNDAIESGLIKTPRVVIRDNSIVNKKLKYRLYHIYTNDEVKDNINRKAEETEPLPDLIVMRITCLSSTVKLPKKHGEN